MNADEIPFGEESKFRVVKRVTPVYDSIPPGLETAAPGPVLAGWLAAIDVSKLSPFDQLEVLKAHRRLASHFQALMYRDMVAVADTEAGECGVDGSPQQYTDEAAGAEVGAALQLTRRGGDIEMAFALGLYRRLPELAAMLESGIVDVARAKVVERCVGHLSDADAQDVVDSITHIAGRLTTGELRAKIRRLCIERGPDDAIDEYASALEKRKIVTEATGFGTANLFGLDLPPDDVQAITNRINQIARSLRGNGESRTMDQLRSDVYLDLLKGTNHQAVGRGVVDIVVDLTTLAGLNNRPGDLGGYGPVIADVARRVLQDEIDAEWRIAVANPDTGDLVAVGITGRRPTASQRRHIQTRDRTCVFPGCRMPAARSDIDHTIAIQDGGTTTDDNLASLCRYHHRIKHDHGWTYEHRDHRIVWTSPSGHTYTKARPPP